MRIPLESMTVDRSIAADRKNILVDVRFTVKLKPIDASRLSRILSTNYLDVQDAEMESMRIDQ